VSNEETAFLANYVANKSLDVTYGDLEAAKSVLLVSFEPEDESPIVFLRLRKAALSGTTKVYAVAPYTSAGLAKMKGTLLVAGPREEVSAIASAASQLSSDSVILVGERAAQTPGALTAVTELATKTGAKLAWIPRRAGDRGALDAGLLPIDGRNTSEIIAATGSAIKGLVVGGVSPEDVDGDLVVAIEKAQFVVSLETRHTELRQKQMWFYQWQLSQKNLEHSETGKVVTAVSQQLLQPQAHLAMLTYWLSWRGNLANHFRLLISGLLLTSQH
jgi:NADH-quinone oxidoreductase subunit G